MNDLISRAATIDLIERMKPYHQDADDIAEMIANMPSSLPNLDEWCTDCKEYSQERHSCPRWNRVIRQTVDDVAQNQWIPCSKRLPDEEFETNMGQKYSDNVLITIVDVDKGETISDYGFILNGKWYSSTIEFYIPDNWKVIAWQPKPKPWKGYNNG